MTDILVGRRRAALCHQPTPLEEMPRLAAELGVPGLWVKRDDCTGLATGGNKTRKLEFLMGDALDRGADVVVTQGAVQSNHVRQTAAAACKLGLGCHALLERRVPGRGEGYETGGNVLLDRLFGATVEFRPEGLDMNAEAEAAADRLRKEGRKPYFIPGGGSNEVGALGYVSCAQELAGQLDERGIRPSWIVVGSGSTGTHSGLVAGLHALGRDVPVMGISVRSDRETQAANVHRLASKTAAQLTDRPLPREKVLVDDGFIGEGYGIPSEGTLAAIRLAARTEGLLLDPVYSGKAMDGLIGLAKAGKIGGDIVFLHTGGAAALFVYREFEQPA